MAWFCSGSTNTELIENLYSSGLIKNERVKQAMLGVSILPSPSLETPFPRFSCPSLDQYPLLAICCI